MTQFDFTLIGGGIVGVATALTLKQLYPDLNVALIEFGILIIAIIRKQITWDGFVKSLMEALRTSCMVMTLIFKRLSK